MKMARVDAMKPEQIIINAIRAEAKIRPNEKIFFGPVTYTFEEFAKMLNGPSNRKEKKIVKNHLKTLIRMFETNDLYRKQVLSFAGV